MIQNLKKNIVRKKIKLRLRLEDENLLKRMKKALARLIELMEWLYEVKTRYYEEEEERSKERKKERNQKSLEVELYKDPKEEKKQEMKPKQLWPQLQEYWRTKKLIHKDDYSFRRK